jgi:membrane fusion protein (multidrug efflux system)
MKKLIISIVIIAAALIGIFTVINKNKANNQKQTEIVAQKNSAVVVTAAPVTYKELNAAYTNNGVFAPKQEVIISSEAAGKVQSVLVKEGAHVSAGQTLAIVKGDKQDVSVSNAQAVYNNAVAEVARFESAYASGGVTKQQLDQIKLQLVNAKNNLRIAQISANDVNVKASFSGIINKRSIEPGSYVNPGQQMFEIVNVGTLKLKVNVDEKSITSVRMGQEVDVISSVLPDETFKGVVTFIAPKADGSLNFPVELEIKNNKNNTLKAGMYGTATFGAHQDVRALVVPRNAFVGNISSNQVFVIKDNKAYLTNVVSGRNFGDYVEILSGVNEGENVVTTGQINLSNETTVQIIK